MALPVWRERLQALADQDIWFVVTACVDRRTDHARIVEMVRDKPDFLAVMLEEEKLFRRLIQEQEAFVKVTPFLFFNILLRQARRELSQTPFILEEDGRQTVPVFAADRLRELLEQEDMLDYLAEMLSSFVRTHTYTAYWRRGDTWYRHRFSDLDLDDVIILAALANEEFRFPLYKRAADVAVFIPGVFSEHALPREHQARSARRTARCLEDYEEAGRKFYRLAASHPAADEGGYAAVLSLLAERFPDARRLLNFLSRQYFADQRFKWFLPPD